MAKTPAKSRQPSKANLSRAAKDMRSPSPQVRREAAEVMTLAARKARKP